MPNKDEKNELFNRNAAITKKEDTNSNTEAQEKARMRRNNIIDKDTHYIFFFGKIASGKTAIITYLINYILEENEGNLVLADLNENPYTNVLLENFTSGTLTKRTDPMEDPIHIDLRYEPRDERKPKKFFTILEIAGEDLEELGNRDNEKGVGSLPKGIQAYFEAAGISITFILCTPYNKANQDVALLSQFIQHVERNRSKLKKYNYVLLSTKWDKNMSRKSIEDFATDNQLQFVIDQIKHKSPLIMGYSIGEVNEADNIVTNVSKKYPKELWHWLYEDMTGVELVDEYIPPKPSLWQQLKDFLTGNNNG